MTAIIHRFRYPWGMRHREVNDPMECDASDALDMLADALEIARNRDAYIDTLVQQPDGVTWIAEDWTDRAREYDSAAKQAERERADDLKHYHRSVA